MSKQHFRTLLHRYRSGTSSEREKKLVEQWFDLLGGDMPARSLEQNRQIEERLWQAIQEKQDYSSKRPQLLRPYRWMSAAAVILLLAVWGGYQYVSNQATGSEASLAVDREKGGTIRRMNDTSADMKIELTDGSLVMLSPHGILEYPAQFASDRREVNLRGSAFFQVSRNPGLPFYVNTGDITTKVLGTSFRVEAGSSNGSVEVSVRTGKVAVFPRNPSGEQTSGKVKSGVILTPNHQVVYSQASQSFVTGLVKQPEVIASPEAAGNPVLPFIFEDTPLSAVLTRMEAAYGIEILLENDELGKCLFTADLTEQPLFIKLDLLCASLNATYEVRGTKILVSGSGCH